MEDGLRSQPPLRNSESHYKTLSLDHDLIVAAAHEKFGSAKLTTVPPQLAAKELNLIEVSSWCIIAVTALRLTTSSALPRRMVTGSPKASSRARMVRAPCLSGDNTGS